MQEFQKMISEKAYNPMSDYLQGLRRKAREKLMAFNSETDEQKRNYIIKSLFGKIGENCFVTPNFFCDYGLNIELGDNVYFNTNCVILDCASVKIGSNTLLGPNVQIYTATHPLDYKTRNSGIESAKSITIGENCWIGGSAVILPGINIGDGCVVGAGSVVTGDFPNNSIIAGNPAKVIRQIEQ